MDQQYENCGNCNKSFPSSNVATHSAYCYRHFKKCLKCDQIIDVNQIKLHEQEYHLNLSCSYCNTTFRPSQHKNHEKQCSMKPKICQYCSIEYGNKQYNAHKMVCGSRTQKCINCNERVILRNIDAHMIICNNDQLQKKQQQIKLEGIFRKQRQYLKSSQRISDISEQEEDPEWQRLKWQEIMMANQQDDIQIERYYQEHLRISQQVESRVSRDLSHNMNKTKSLTQHYDDEYSPEEMENQKIILASYESYFNNQLKTNHDRK